jgi:hypothetical protein
MRYLYLFIFLFFTKALFGQQAIFIVLCTKGNVAVINDGRKSPAKIGLKLFGNEHIVVADKSEVTLVCSSEGYVLLNKKGEYNIAGYLNKCQAPKSNIMIGYLKYAWSEFSRTEASNSIDDQEQMDNIGAAVRGANKCYASIDTALQMINYYAGGFPLSWKNNTSSPLRLKVFEYPDGGNPVIDIPVNAPKYDLGRLTTALKKGHDYFWTLMPKYDELCPRNHIEIWEKADYDLLLKTFKNQASSITSDNAEQLFIMGYLLENMHFLAEARKYYSDAAIMAPANKKYSNKLNNYKKRFNLP